VFVTGAAQYPQNPGVNPTDTLCALAYRTSDAIVQRYLAAPRRLIDTAPTLPPPRTDVGVDDAGAGEAAPSATCRRHHNDGPGAQRVRDSSPHPPA